LILGHKIYIVLYLVLL